MTRTHIQAPCLGCPDHGYCPVCDGGLFTCSVCGASEGELPTECPGRVLSQEERERIYAGLLDFKDGQFVEVPHD